MKHKILKPFLAVLLSLIFFMLCLGFLFYQGILQFNHPSKELYPIRGVDISSYQGEIDWKILSEQDIQFAFIKATEGSSFEDPFFQQNWKKASDTSLRIGAYHFFSYDSPGISQAKHFIKTVQSKEEMLPPVVDVEFYGDKESNPPKADEVVKELTAYLDLLESHYGTKPIIYATHKSYDLYIMGDFEEYPIWIRDIFQTPKLKDNRQWTFWQFSNRMVLKGYQGKEKYIDMNVFYGSEEEFLNYES